MQSVLPLRLRVELCAHDLDADERLVPFNPCIVSGRNRVGHAGNNRCLLAVGHLHDDAPRHGIADVRGLAAVGFGHGLDAL